MFVFNVCRVFLLQFILWYQLKLTNSSPIMSDTKLDKVPKTRYPFVVAIMSINPQLKIEENLRCGGSLIALNLVLTAAHCLIPWKANQTEVMVGSVDLKAGERYEVHSWKTYDFWAREKDINATYVDNDIAVLQLKTRVEASIPLGVLTTDSFERFRGTKVLTVGWGQTKKTRYPRYLSQVNVDILTIDAQNKYERDTYYSLRSEENFFWGRGDPHAVVHFGDSGSPLMKKEGNKVYKIIGVVVGYGPQEFGDDIENSLNAFISIDPYRTFIADIISEQKLILSCREKSIMRY